MIPKIDCAKVFDLFNQVQAQKNEANGLMENYKLRQMDWAEGEKIDKSLLLFQTQVKKMELALLCGSFVGASISQIESNQEIGIRMSPNWLFRAGYHIDDYARDALHSVDWTKNPPGSQEVILLKVGELSDDVNTHTYAYIKTKAKELGLELVPTHFVPSIRAKYPNEEESLVVATEATKLGESTYLFDLYRFEGRAALGVLDGYDDKEWNTDRRFLFIRP